MSPKECAEASDKHIHEYVKEVGAYGDARKVMQAMEMLISKCALGYGQLAGQEAVIDLLLRTSMNVAQRLNEQAEAKANTKKH